MAVRPSFWSDCDHTRKAREGPISSQKRGLMMTVRCGWWATNGWKVDEGFFVLFLFERRTNLDTSCLAEAPVPYAPWFQFMKW